MRFVHFSITASPSAVMCAILKPTECSILLKVGKISVKQTTSLNVLIVLSASLGPLSYE